MIKLPQLINKQWQTDISLLFLRLSFGLTMITLHGWRKMMKFPALKETFRDPLGIGSTASLFFAASAEVGASMLLMMGLFTRFSAVSLLFTMSVIFFMVHGADPMTRKELPLLYATVYLVLLIAGPGRISLDYLLKKWLK